MYVDVKSGQPDWIQIYRLCIGFVNPRPIALVSTISPDGRHNLAPFSLFNMVSANPPVLFISPALRRDGSAKDTLINVEATGEFVVATVTADIAQAMANCAADLAYEESEFDFSGLTPTPSTHVRPPLVREAKVNTECTLRQIVKTGDGPGSSSVIFGDIVAIHISDEILDADGLIDPHKLQTVGRLGGQWYCTMTEPYQLTVPKV